MFRRTTVEIVGYVFAYFSGERKKNVWLQFRSSFELADQSIHALSVLKLEKAEDTSCRVDGLNVVLKCCFRKE